MSTAGEREFESPESAVEHLNKLYQRSVTDLREAFGVYAQGALEEKVEVFYPQVSVEVLKPSRERDKRDSFGFMTQPGNYIATITRPDLYREYLIDQLTAIRHNHPSSKIKVSYSEIPIPLHFTFGAGHHVEGGLSEGLQQDIPYHFTVPSALNGAIDNEVVDGLFDYSGDTMPLSLFSAPRIDKSLGRISYYTGTRPEFFQNHMCFSNYDAYICKFKEMAKDLFSNGENEAKSRLGENSSTSYLAFVEPGNVITLNHNVPNVKEKFDYVSGGTPERPSQMPAYHLIKENGKGISFINIGVGPSNAQNMTDHLAVLRPDLFFMLGHCAGLADEQKLGDYVLANAYHRRDGVLDGYVPLDIPIPDLSEVHNAISTGIKKAVSFNVGEVSDNDLKGRYRTGTVVTEYNRNWEEDPPAVLRKRFSQSRAIGLDMESATVATNGFRYRVPYGALLCVSDKPLQGEIKLEGMVNEFYKKSVEEHYWAGIHTMQAFEQGDLQRKHSRKLRSPFEPPFR